MGLIVVCCILTLTALFSKAEISEKENRTLQALPEFSMNSYLNGSFFKDLESYFYDHFPQRDSVLEIVTLYDKAKGIQSEIMALEKGNNMNLVNSAAEKKEDVSPAESNETLAKTGEATKETSEKKEDDSGIDFSEYKTQTQNLGIIAVKDRLLELYHFQEDNIAAYAKALNLFAEKMPKQVRMYSLVAPTQVGLTDREYSEFSDPQDKAIAYLYSLLDQRYQPVDVFSSLYQRREDYIYFRSDHHWTQLGAYYAAREFAAVAGTGFKELTEYQKHSFEGFLGYLYSNNQVEKVAQNPDRLDAYVIPNQNLEITNFYYQQDGSLSSYEQPLINLEMAKDTATYGIFLGGDFPIIVYENPQPKSGRRLLVVKDSYANSFVPWIASEFDKIVVIDPRFYKENIFALVEKQEITDFMVLDYIMVTVLDGFIEYLNQIGSR